MTSMIGTEIVDSLFDEFKNEVPLAKYTCEQTYALVHICFMAGLMISHTHVDRMLRSVINNRDFKEMIELVKYLRKVQEQAGRKQLELLREYAHEDTVRHLDKMEQKPH